MAVIMTTMMVAVAVVMVMVIVMVVVMVMVMVMMIDGCPMHYENGRECFHLGTKLIFSRAMAAMQSWQIAFVV